MSGGVQHRRWRIVCCAAAVLLGLAAAAATPLPLWLRATSGFTALLLLGAAGGHLTAHAILDDRARPVLRRGRW